MTQDKARKRNTRTRAGGTRDRRTEMSYTEAHRTDPHDTEQGRASEITDQPTDQPWRGAVWLNPPKATQEEKDRLQFLMLSRREVQVLRQALATALDTEPEPHLEAGRERVLLLRGIDLELEGGAMTPDEADQRLSREATWHPANQYSRLMPAVLRALTRWSGGVCVVANAIEEAAAIEASRSGWAGVEQVTRAAHNYADRAADCAYGRVTPTGTYLEQADDDGRAQPTEP
jgi:hypothetical protein